MLHDHKDSNPGSILHSSLLKELSFSFNCVVVIDCHYNIEHSWFTIELTPQNLMRLASEIHASMTPLLETGVTPTLAWSKSVVSRASKRTVSTRISHVD